MAYRRDIQLWVEYATIQTDIGYPITAPVVATEIAPTIMTRAA